MSKSDQQVQSIFSLRGHPAKGSVPPDFEVDWTTTVLTWRSSFFAWLSECGPAGWFGRTSPACLPLVPQQPQATTAEPEQTTLIPMPTIAEEPIATSDTSLPAFKNSGMGSPTEFWTLNTS